MYADALRERFPDLDPVVADLFLLEAHQIAELPNRVPPADLAAVLRAHETLRDFLVTRSPASEPFLSELLDAHHDEQEDVAAAEDRLLWEVADLIVYQRAPAMYDDRIGKLWGRSAFEEVEPLQGKVVIDAGAGTGHVTFTVAPFSESVFSVEPVAALRAYMRAKADDLGLLNVFVMDGLLRAIPLPANSADVLLTHRAIGWDLESELEEIERVVRPGGVALHLGGLPYPADDTAPLHEPLLAAGYEECSYQDGPSLNRKYYKRI